MTNVGAWGAPIPPMLSDCPSCDKPVLAHVQGTYVEPDEDGPQILHSLACCGDCGSALLLGQQEEEAGWSTPVRLYPQGNERPLSISVPTELRREHEEAWACFKARAYTATAVMVRRTLEGVCQDQGIAKKQPLAASLKQLASDGRIEGRLLEWAEALRFLGNQGAHYTGTPVSREDAADALALAEALLDYMYVLTAQYEKFQQRRAVGRTETSNEARGATTVQPQA
ncbi:DUF4145 domain-containing protein [Streptomyces sp. NPDC015127]|uniref:DUF4145 domain-containing protein n=1 Tax=Streptomyces sp. NPDC015127 TaxID=3364939 RepID=UPI0036F6233D